MKIYVCWLMLCAVPGIAWAQADANKGQIVGTVMDPNQAVIPNAAITIKNANTGAVRDLTTNEAGQFRAVLLDPGTYDLTVSVPGFAPKTMTGIVVNVGSAVDVPVTLQIGTTTQTVEVTAPPINLDLSAPSEIMNTLAIRDLPINGRRFQDFALLAPTVQVEPSRSQLSFVGQRGINSNVMVDGADYNNPFFGGIRGGERSNSIITVPQSSVQEFQVVVDGYAAEYGRSTGGVLNAITKSGTNEYHGEGFFQIRPAEAGLDTPFNKPILETLKQFGGAVGGPIKKDRIFWFASAERQLSSTPRQTQFGNLANVTPNANTQEAYAFYKSLEGPLPTTNDAVATLGRLDWQLTDKHRLALRYNFSDATADNAVTTGNALPTFIPEAASQQGTEADRTHSGLAELTSILSANLVNTLRAGSTYELRPRLANAEAPTVSNAVGSFGTRSFLPNTENDIRTQVADSLSLIHGRHAFKVGFDYNRITASQSFGFNQFGSFGFLTSDTNTILDILGVGGAIPNRFDSPLITYRREIGNLLASVAMNQIAFFVQDSWRVTPRLGIDLGVRWEGQKNPQPEANNTAVLNAVESITFPNGAKLDPTRIANSMNQWMPRFGFTFRPTSGDRTVIRGNAGIFYAATPLLVFTGPENNFRLPPGDVFIQLPLNSSNSTVYKDFLAAGVDLNKYSLDKLPILDVATVQKAAAAEGGAPDPFRGAGFSAMANDFRNPRAIQAGIGLEQQLFGNWVAAAQFNYVNTVHLERNRDYNLGVPSVAPGDASLRPVFGARPLPQYSVLTVRESSARSLYRGLSLNSRYKGTRFQWMASYTLSYAYSDDDNERDATGVQYDNAFNLKQNYGYSNLDTRHQFASNAVAFLPFGLELSGIYRFRSGLPIDPLVGSDLNKDSQSSDRAYKSPGVPFPRNSFRNFAFNDVDVRVLKNFRFKERYQLQLSVEMFNLCNFNNIFIAGSNLNYGAGVNTQGQVIPPLATFRQLRVVSGPLAGTLSTVNTQIGNPFQSQFGARFLF